MDVSTDRKCYSVFRAGIPKFNFGKLADSALFSCVLVCLKYIHYLLKAAALSAKLNPPLANKVNRNKGLWGERSHQRKRICFPDKTIFSSEYGSIATIVSTYQAHFAQYVTL